MDKERFLYLIAAGLFAVSCGSQTASVKGYTEDLLKQMTLEEKVLLTVGTGWGHEMTNFIGDSVATYTLKKSYPGAAGFSYPIPRLDIPGTRFFDGPAGVRIEPKRANDTATYYATAFPIETLLASTWNAGLIEEVGHAMGNEALEYGADILLAPALNIHRNPLCGRNYEYYSEDPFVSGKMAAAMVRGIQSNGIGASVKHLAANSQESYRYFNDAQVGERALREIYLKGFEIAVKESEPWMVMSSYNRLNGVYTSESKELLTGILRDEWGFEGVSVTDWAGGQDAAAQLSAGTDLIQPGNRDKYQQIMDALKTGILQEERLNTSVSHILNYIFKTPAWKKYPHTNKPDLASHAKIARSAGQEGMVLLKNVRNVLPLPVGSKIGAFGLTFYDFVSGGMGSGDVNEAYTVSAYEGMSDAGYLVDVTLAAEYEKYLEENKPKEVRYIYSNPDPSRIDECTFSEEEIRKVEKRTDVAFITIGRNSGEGIDRKVNNDFNLTAAEQSLIRNVCKVYHEVNKSVVVLLNIGGVIETASWKDLPDAILLAWQPGQEGGNAVADIVSGKATPSGKLTMTFPNSYWDVPSAKTFPYDFVEKREQSLEDSIFNVTPNIGTTHYEEDIWVGYRYYDKFDKAVSYPFGYGLSYTQFEYSDAEIKWDKLKDAFVLKVNIRNIGDLPGKEVVQIYTTAPLNSKYDKPAQELKSFAKTKVLLPGKAETLKFIIPVSDLASFDEAVHAWKVDKGNYIFHVAASSQDIRADLQGKVY